jgi:glycosyltransferase involved in cell wall biosynthesis
MPVYNKEQYLRQCLDSLAKQTLQNVEIILIDDGSADGSTAVLRGFAEKDERVRLVRQENRGAGAARNTGLDLAKGRYLSFLDADDLFAPNMLEAALREADRCNADIVVFNFSIIHPQEGYNINRGNWNTFMQEDTNKEVFCARDIPETIYQFTTGSCWNKLFRADFVRGAGVRFQEIGKYNDLYFMFMTAATASRIRFLRETLLCYRFGMPDAVGNASNFMKHRTSICQWVIAVRTSLLQLGLYDEVKRSFLNFAFDHLRLNFLAYCEFGSKEKYVDFFNTVRGEWLKEWDAEGLPSGYFYEEKTTSFYESLIQSTDAYEHLFVLAAILSEERSLFERELHNLDIQFHKLDESKHFVLSDARVERSSRLVIYGAGDVGKDYVAQLRKYRYAQIVLWVDKNFAELSEYDVRAPEELKNVQYDYVVIAVYDSDAAREIADRLRSLGVPGDKIIWQYGKGETQ